MRRLTLALSFSLVFTPALLAQQAPQTARPATPPPGVTKPAPPTSAPAVAMPSAQTPRPGTTPPRDVFAIAGLPQAGSGQNVQLAVRISDSFSSELQTTKTVTMLVADYQSGQIRSSGSGSEGVINIDARPQAQRDNRIRLQLTLEYRPDLTAEQFEQLQRAAKGGAVRIQTLTESLTVLLTDGKPTLVSQSSDPRSDRKVAVEVTATIVK